MFKPLIFSTMLLAVPVGTAADPLRPVDAPNKTSDRTPNNPSPARTTGSSATGAAGTEVARTPSGTSDRTPSNHYKPHSY
jgi:hypothetical protein